MAYLGEHIPEYRLKRDDIMLEVTDAAGESSKDPRLQHALQGFDENVDVIGLVNFNWGHAVNKSLPIEDSVSASGLSLSQRAPSSRTSML